MFAQASHDGSRRLKVATKLRRLIPRHLFVLRGGLGRVLAVNARGERTELHREPSRASRLGVEGAHIRVKRVELRINAQHREQRGRRRGVALFPLRAALRIVLGLHE